MDKQQLIIQIVAQLQADLAVNVAAANEAHEAATHEESVAENQYDTLGLEASYLAHGQSQRVQALEADIAAYQQMPLKKFSADMSVGLSALVSLEDSAGCEKCLFIGVAGGGIKIVRRDHSVIVVTPRAPLGAALIGRFVGDRVTLPQGEFEITDLC
ncbi:transcription elongation factor GreAB [Amphritea sp. 1_MG-2023]|uniref:transcription elongation factor GreAB n=1 Tax=Amphritea sp. 1_MG-2023 TaxID=3062670 RepID=UPI0026E26C56|nr:transcription elongation factor GreAB [Amphritea sp. 1_MG-2023]MDO6561839.1 transcription elongation factor GreAB [Amphritea sp. 1_MG-2023]